MFSFYIHLFILSTCTIGLYYVKLNWLMNIQTIWACFPIIFSKWYSIYAVEETKFFLVSLLKNWWELIQMKNTKN